jgi:hypothetical protein
MNQKNPKYGSFLPQKAQQFKKKIKVGNDPKPRPW